MDKETQDKVLDLLTYASNNVPFYRNYFNGKAPQTLEDAPFITKADIIENFDSFISKDVDWNDCSVEFTTGSTGRALRCVKSGRDTLISQRKLWKLRSEWLPGILRKRLLAFSNSFLLQPDWPRAGGEGAFNQSDDMAKKYYSNVDLRYFTPRELSEAPAEELLDRIRLVKADWIRATPSVIYAFCMRVESMNGGQPINSSSIKFIEVTGETISDAERAVIERTFGCKVANLYATREVWPIAYECLFGQLHIVESHIHCEVVNQEKYEAEGAGELCLTALNQRVFPFIRYLIGDVVSIERANCRCGSEGNIIRSIEGRVGQMILIGGKSYSCQIFSELVKELVRLNIVEAGRFFVVQKQEYLFEMTIERRGHVSEDYAAYIQSFIQKYLVPEVKVVPHVVDSLGQQHTEKRKFFFSEIY